MTFLTDPKLLENHSDFLSDESEKIVALDPDYFNWSFSKDNIAVLKNVKAICLATTSFSWVDVQAASQLGIPVTNLRGFSTEAVAEYTLLMTLSVARKMPLVVKDNYKQDFVRHQGVELRGKTAAIIGLGRIGERIAKLMESIGMNVVYWSKSEKENRFKKIELVDLFKTADVIFPTLAQNQETENLITDEMLMSMKPEAIFVSIVHKVYNHDLLLKLVKESKIFGYAFEGDNENPLKYEGNVFASPAIAWATKESMESNGIMWTDSILAAANNEFPTRIN